MVKKLSQPAQPAQPAQHNKTDKFDEQNMKCAPNAEFTDGSCISLNLLVSMATAYNKTNPSKLISLYPKMHQSDYKKYLLSEFVEKIGPNQKEWAKSKYFESLNANDKDKLENKTFRPDGPQGRFDWLSTIDINQALYQYEDKHNDFKFLGAVPIDFAELDYLPFKTLNFKDLENEKYKRIGVIFNTDKSTQRGKHWISLFFDLEKAQIYFSDSVGIKPPEPVRQFIQKIEKYLNSKGLNVDSRYNKTEHQKKNTECGVYSINFILRLLKGKTFEQITEKKINDDKINQCRMRYFRKTKKEDFK
jgi:hypothetical protein